ncbi:MAG: hypothetical protein LAN70_12035 [Acidobacteriia bacterium]|nr:hypothetical protein [Terriglobia bacterium]
MPFRKLIFCAAILLLIASTATAADIPQLSADAGPCWAEFTVTDAAHKPVYLAKINTIVRYGFMSKRKTELELSTDSNGRGKFTGLPHDVKKPLAFTITYQDQSKTVTHDPATNCHAAFDVALDGTAAK